MPLTERIPRSRQGRAAILPKLHGPAFLEAFTAKGRMRDLLRAVPVRVVLNDRAALLGAARHGADLLAG
jgi:glucokinase